MPRTKRKSKKKEDNQFNKSALDQEIVQDFSHYVDKKSTDKNLTRYLIQFVHTSHFLVEQMQTNLKIREESIHLQFKTELEVKFIKFHKYFNTPLTELVSILSSKRFFQSINLRLLTLFLFI